jgi:tetratricopeptide (TPR) repeat protein
MKSAILLLAILASSQLPAQSDAQPDNDWKQVTHTAQSQYAQHQNAEAVASARRALQIAKRFGPTDHRAAVNYYQLGNIYREWAHCSEARANYSHAIAIWEKQPDGRHQFLFDAIANQLGTMCECDEVDAASKQLRVYEPKLKIYQSGPVDEVRVFAIRATIFHLQRKYKQAENYYRQAIQLLERTPGAPPGLLLHQQIDLVTVVNQQGRHAESLAQSQKLIDLYEQAEPDPVGLVWALNNAGCSLTDLGRIEEAQPMFERALRLSNETYGEDNRATAKIMLNYARVLRKTKQTPAADAMLKKGTETLHRSIVRASSTVNVADLGR